MKYGLSKKQLDEIIRIIADFTDVEEAVLFGSRAIDTFKEASDVDIAIKGEKVSASLAAKLKYQLEEETYLPFFFDFIAWPTIINDELKKHIRDKGVVIYRKGLMGKWKECTLGDLTLLVTKGTTPKKFTDCGINFVKSQSISYDGRIDKSLFGFIDEETHGKFTRSQLAKDDILFSMAGIFLGKNAIVSKEILPANTNQALAIIRLNPEIALPKFIHYFLKQKSTIEFVNNMSGQSAQPNINFQEIKSIELSVPPLPEQKAIASVLSSLDDKIDLLHRQNKTLEAMAETLFRQWFVQPIIQAERDGSKAVGFQNGKFGKWIETTLGGDWGKENPTGDFVVPVYCIRGTDIADLNTGIPEKTPVRHVKKEKFENIEPKEGDIIIEISGGTENQSTGRTSYINSDIRSLFQLPLVFSNFCRLLKIKKEEYSFFVYSYLQYLYNQDEFFNLENGSSGIKNLDYKALLFELDYPMPQESMVAEFDEEVKDYFKKINQNKSQIRTLEKLRDTLLPKLLSGEVRVEMEISNA